MPPRRWMTPVDKGETRVDPSDNTRYTFEEFSRVYRHQYSSAQIKDYWQKEMAPVAFGEGVAQPSLGTSTLQSRDDAIQLVSGLPNVTFCPDPKTIGASFTATYDKDPQVNFASVNAGAYSLKVGGSALNGQFENDLRALGWQQTDKYSSFHTKLFSEADVGKFTAASRDLVATSMNLQAGFVRKATDDKVCCVFVDVFKQDRCVHGNAKNMGMVYAVGPRRRDCQSDAVFLGQVEAVGQNISRTCSEYNARVAEIGASRIEVLRVPMVSGGKFAGNCSKDAVALALIRGLINGSSSESPVLNFAFDGDIFRKTWESFQIGSLQISRAPHTCLPVAAPLPTASGYSNRSGGVAASSVAPATMRFSRFDSVTMINGDDLSKELSQEKLPTITNVLRLKQELHLPAPASHYRVMIGEQEVLDDFPLQYDREFDQGLKVVVKISMPDQATVE